MATTPNPVATVPVTKQDVNVRANLTRTVRHYLENAGISLNGGEIAPLVNALVYMVENGGTLNKDVATANAAREAEAASHLKQAADAIEMNKPKTK